MLEAILQTNYQPYSVRDIEVTEERKLENGTLLATMWWTALGAYGTTEIGSMKFEIYSLFFLYIARLCLEKEES